MTLGPNKCFNTDKHKVRSASLTVAGYSWRLHITNMSKNEKQPFCNRQRNQAFVKAKPDASDAKPIKVRKDEEVVVLLSGGNPQIAKADGDAPVQECIAAMPGWKRDLGKRLDALIVQNAPNVSKAVKWNSPFYAIEGQGWFLSFHVFNLYVKVTFIRGTSLRSVPPGGTARSKDTRWIDIREGERFAEIQMATWVKQAAVLPGWVP